MIKTFDILLVSETKLDTYDVISIDGYAFINVPRKAKYLRKSGGLGAFIKQELFQHVEIIESETDLIFWIKISGHGIHSNTDVMLGNVYVPPMSSRFYKIDEHELFKNEITDMCSKFELLYLFGDFNAQTGGLIDYTDCDEFLANMFDLDQETISFLDQKSRMEQNGIQLIRNSKDKKTNNHGYKLIELCKNNSVFIVNGRVGKDKNVGKMTFKNLSVIDYMLSTIEGYSLLSYFDVLPTDCIYSDGHALLSCKLNISTNNSLHTQSFKLNQKPKWDAAYKNEFLSNISEDKLQSLAQKIDDAKIQQNSCQIDQITDSLANIMIDSANDTFITPEPTKFTSNCKSHKPWYGLECKKLRKRYNKAKRKYFKYPSEENRLDMKTCCKIYKKKMNDFIMKYNKNNEIKLRNMQSKRPKDYWKYLNKIKPTSKVDKTPDLNSLFQHFKEASNDNSHEQNYDEILENLNLNDQTNCLNSQITQTEIESCIKLLKNNKSAGNDNIINEYIKFSKSKLLPVYKDIFNLIFDTGYIPKTWSEGVICPIYKNKGDPTDANNYRPITLLSCVSKLFTSILNKRISSFLEENDILLENQAGFRKTYSTSDHIFTLNSIIEILRHSKKKIYCIFIDFSKVFDSVWRVGLWKKLLKTNINGKFFRIIQNMYSNIQSCVSLNGTKSDLFSCNCGVRQGENLSPILFSLFLNDLEDYLKEKGNTGVQLPILADNTTELINIISMLYADDTILVSDDPSKLQKCYKNV